MTLKKTNRTGSDGLIQKLNCLNILKACSSVMLILVAIFFTTSLFAQNNKDTSTFNSSSSGDDISKQMLDYSRPGKYHQLLADLVGTWTFKGSHFEWVDSVTSREAVGLFGKVVRKSFANGRFFIAEVAMGDKLHKLQLPIQDGKMIEGNGKAIQTEGYDNVKKKFILTLITNHIGSAILFWEGSYDSTTKTITFDSEIENVPGMKTKNRLLVIFNDKDHYKWENYVEQNGKYRKATEMYFTRAKGK